MRFVRTKQHWQSLTDIAEREGMPLSQVNRIAQLIYLAPDIVDGVLCDMQPLALEKIIRRKVAADWQHQRAYLLKP